MSTGLIESPQSTALSTAAAGVQSRQMAEVQSSMIIAKKFPRDEDACHERIMKACKRTRLAMQAEYVFPRGKEKVTGPTIRLLETIAQAWGNIDFGVIEVERKESESVCQAYAWDLETNTRRTSNFTVSFYIKAKGKLEKITDPRDLQAHIQAQGARHVRNCIAAIVPGDVVDDAIDQCRQTLKAAEGNKSPKERMAGMVPAFAELGVTQGMLVAFLKHNLESTTEAEFQKLRKIYQSLKQEASNVEDWFPVDGVVEPNAAGEPKQDQIEG